MHGHVLEGKPRVITLSATSVGAGNLDVDLRPDEGKVWEILFAYGWQDDGAVAVYWYVSDADSSDVMICGMTAGGNTRTFAVPLCAKNDSLTAVQMAVSPLMATRQLYFTWRFAASAAAKTGYVLALVKEYRGIQSDL